MTKLTEKELAVLKAIDHSEYGDGILETIWTFSVWDNIDKSVVEKQSSLSGIFSSLTKKGFILSDAFQGTGQGLDDDATVEMTQEGAEAYFEAIGGKDKANKWID